MKSQELGISKLKSKLDDLMNGNKTPTSIKNLETELKKAEKEAAKLQSEYDGIGNQINGKTQELETEISMGDLKDNNKVSSLRTQINDLDQESIEIAEKLENAKDKVEQLKDALKSAKMNPVNSTEAQQLQQEIDNLKSKLSQTQDEANQLKNELIDILNQKKNSKLGSQFEELGKKINKVGTKIARLIISVAVFDIIRKGLSALKDSFFSLLKTNSNFSSSLNQIKANLMTAFAPIYNAILPAINTLMNALTQVTGTIATFVSSLFGISLSNATKQAKDLSNALQKTSKSSEEASGSLASFDKLEVIGGQDVGTTNGGNSNSIDYSGEITSNSKLLEFFNKIKDSLSGIDFSNLNQSLGTLWDKLSKFGSIVGGALWWVWENILVPLAKWTIEDVLPAFLDILSGALSVINSVLEKAQPMLKFLWENFLQPIAEWTGGVIVTVLEDIALALEWIAGQENLCTFLASLAVAIGTVEAATQLWTIANKLWNAVMNANPIIWLVGLIVALIAIIVECVKHWDEIKEVASKCWQTIKEAWNGAATWFNNTIVQPIANFFSGIWNGLINGAKGAWNGIKSVFSTVATFFKNIFTNAWTAVKNVFSVGGKIFDGIKDGILNGFKAIVNAIIKGINKVIATPFNGLNSALNRIQNIGFLGIEPFKWLSWRAPIPKIPELAKGAVIPPRHRFAAILGDQKHGTNIEAPLETIKQANREVFQEFMGMLLGMNGNDREIVFKNLTIVAQFGNKDFSKIVVDAVRMAEKELGKQLFVN